MKRLTLIRHAKSSWNYPELTDFERPLNGRGRRDAPAMALRIARKLGMPDLWVSSPASRAITTARLFTEALAVPATDLLLNSDVYDADIEQLLDVLATLPARAHRVWLFGHNPGLSELSQWLSPGAPTHLPTCAAVGFDLSIESWSALKPGIGRLVAHLYPKQASE